MECIGFLKIDWEFKPLCRYILVSYVCCYSVELLCVYIITCDNTTNTECLIETGKYFLGLLRQENAVVRNCKCMSRFKKMWFVLRTNNNEVHSSFKLLNLLISSSFVVLLLKHISCFFFRVSFLILRESE